MNGAASVSGGSTVEKGQKAGLSFLASAANKQFVSSDMKLFWE